MEITSSEFNIIDRKEKSEAFIVSDLPCESVYQIKEGKCVS